MSQTESHVYARQLLPKGHGYPLWVPEPADDLPPECKARGVSVGDVGIITSDGAFNHIFNICLPPDDPANSLGVPSGFEQVRLGPRDIGVYFQRHSPGSDIASTSLSKKKLNVEVSSEGNPAVPAGIGAGIQFTSTSKEGAVLLLPNGACRSNLQRLRVFREYALRHGTSWYEFVNVTLEREAQSGSLYLVTGCDKAATWGVASFSNTSGEGEISLKFTAVQVGTATASYEWQWETFSPAAVRTGPKRVPGDPDRPQNQCVFVRGYKVIVREGMAALRGAIKVRSVEDSKPHQILANKHTVPFTTSSSVFGKWSKSSRSSTGGPQDAQESEQVDDFDVVLEHIPELLEPYHPLTVINKFLLESMPEAQVAVTHDNDWCGILHEDETTFPDDAEILRRIQRYFSPSIAFGGAFLLPREAQSAQGEGTLPKLPISEANQPPITDTLSIPLASLTTKRPVSPTFLDNSLAALLRSETRVTRRRWSPTTGFKEKTKEKAKPTLVETPQQTIQTRLSQETLPSVTPTLVSPAIEKSKPLLSKFGSRVDGTRRRIIPPRLSQETLPSVTPTLVNLDKPILGKRQSTVEQQSPKRYAGVWRDDFLGLPKSQVSSRSPSLESRSSTASFSSPALHLAGRNRSVESLPELLVPFPRTRSARHSVDTPASPSITNDVPPTPRRPRTTPVNALPSLTTSSLLPSRNEPRLGAPAESLFPKAKPDLRERFQSDSIILKALVIREEGKPSIHFQLGHCIGRGRFANVYRALNLLSGQMVAVKRIPLQGMTEEDIALVLKEANVIKSLSHPSIVKCEGVIRDEDTLSIVLEYVENGSLLQTLKAFGHLNERLATTYTVKILEGLHYLHLSGVVHGDLKASNILTTKNGNVKLSDFSASLNLRAVEGKIQDVTGSPNWMAPEVIELKGASPQSDIWSLACTVIEMVTGKPPYAEITNSMSVMFRIVDDNMPPLPEGRSKLLHDFLTLCFKKDPKKRPTAETLCEHPWLRSGLSARPELLSDDGIPFLRRVTTELEKSEAALNRSRRLTTGLADSNASQVFGDAAKRSPGRRYSNFSARGISSPATPREHSFVKVSFNKGQQCSECNTNVTKNAVICENCGLIAHSKCSTKVSSCQPMPPQPDVGQRAAGLEAPELDLLAKAILPKVPKPRGLVERSKVAADKGIDGAPLPIRPISRRIIPKKADVGSPVASTTNTQTDDTRGSMNPPDPPRSAKADPWAYFVKPDLSGIRSRTPSPPPARGRTFGQSLPSLNQPNRTSAIIPRPKPIKTGLARSREEKDCTIQ